MSHMEEPSNGVLQFQWGTKRGLGGAKKDVQFYESFTLDGVTYTLYDNVYLFKTGETEPYIGKIIKIWEQGDAKRKVKILWFFEPSDILNYLGDYKPLEKEIFLASGDGVGLANINPLEAVAAKCSVICTSNDARNPQPSKNALDGAEFVFSHTFDVGTHTISDKFPDKIAGIEVKFLLNRKADEDVSGANALEAALLKHKEVAEAGTLEGNRVDERITLLKRKNVGESDNRGDERDNRGDERAASVKHKSVGDADTSGAYHGDERAASLKHKNVGNADTAEANHGDLRAASVKHKNVGDADIAEANHDGDERAASLKHKARTDLSNEKSSKKVRLNDNSEKKQLSEKKKSSNELIQKASLAASGQNNTASEHQIVVARKPDADRKKWFKELPWDGRLQKANEQGTLMFLQNFDRSLSSRDIEDIIYHSFKYICVAKVIPLLPPYLNPHHGQAYVIFKKPEAADEAIQRINKGCLMIQNKSALMASKGMLKIPEKATTLLGHMTINKVKMMQREETRKAVSTSHCSQPNTIEYEMAMEWILAQEKTVACLNQLYKRHGDDGKQVWKHLKSAK